MGAQENPAVVAFLRDLDHPLRPQIEEVRAIILGADPSIGELIKWKAPTFRAADDFATFHLRSTDKIQMIFHTGVKVKSGEGPAVADPDNLLKWLAKDRAMLTLEPDGIEARRPALEALVRAWIAQVPA